MLHLLGFFIRNPKASSTDGYPAIRYSSRNTTLHHELTWIAELAGHWKGLRREGAYISRLPYVNTEKSKLTDITPAWGWYVQAGYLLFGGHQNYDAGGAKYTRTNNGRKWGDIELCARVEYADTNDLQKGFGAGLSAKNGVKFELVDALPTPGAANGEETGEIEHD